MEEDVEKNFRSENVLSFPRPLEVQCDGDPLDFSKFDAFSVLTTGETQELFDMDISDSSLNLPSAPFSSQAEKVSLKTSGDAVVSVSQLSMLDQAIMECLSSIANSPSPIQVNRPAESPQTGLAYSEPGRSLQGDNCCVIWSHDHSSTPSTSDNGKLPQFGGTWCQIFQPSNRSGTSVVTQPFAYLNSSPNPQTGHNPIGGQPIVRDKSQLRKGKAFLLYWKDCIGWSLWSPQLLYALICSSFCLVSTTKISVAVSSLSCSVVVSITHP